MPREIILLTTELEGQHLASMLRSHQPGLAVEIACDPVMLERACISGDPLGRRLVAFCTDVIVPKRILDAVMRPAYNFHPGSPAYPGSHSAGFAIYDGAERFGATVHEMTPRVDEGAIVAIEDFEVPDGVRVDQLDILTYKALANLFRRLARHLATEDRPLERLRDVRWSGLKHTKAEAEAMRELPPDCPEEEIRRRFRAFG